MRYRNERTGRVLERPGVDEWLEASSGWARVEEPKPEAPAKETDKKETE